MMNLYTKLSEAQLYGFFHAKQGFNLRSLIEAMDLKPKEWEEIKAKYPKTVPQKYWHEIDKLILENQVFD
jgi:hypothetical protein